MSVIDKAVKLVGGLRPELKEKVLPMNVQTPEEFMQHAKNFESTELVMATSYLRVKPMEWSEPMATSQSNRYSTVAAIYPRRRSQLRKVTFDDRPNLLEKDQRERRDRRMNHQPIHRSESCNHPRYDQSRYCDRGMKRDRQSKFHGMKCFRCGRYGHIRRECWSPRQSNHRPLSINQIEGNRSREFQCRICHEVHPSKRDLSEHLRLTGHYSAKRSDESIRQHDWTIRRKINRRIDHRIRNDRKKRLWPIVDRFSSHRNDLSTNVAIELCSVSTQTDDPVEFIGTTIARSEIRGSNRRQLMKLMNGTDGESNHREPTKGTIGLIDEYDHRPAVEKGAESNDQWNRRQPSKRNRRVNHRQSPDRTIDSSDQPDCRQQERTTTEPSKRWNFTQSSGPKDRVSDRLASGQSGEAMMESKDRWNCSTWSKTSEIGNAERIKSYLREVITLLSDPMIERLDLFDENLMDMKKVNCPRESR